MALYNFFYLIFIITLQERPRLTETEVQRCSVTFSGPYNLHAAGSAQPLAFPTESREHKHLNGWGTASPHVIPSGNLNACSFGFKRFPEG